MVGLRRRWTCRMFLLRFTLQLFFFVRPTLPQAAAMTMTEGEVCTLELDWDWPDGSFVLRGGIEGHWSEGTDVQVLANTHDLEVGVHAACPGSTRPGASVKVYRDGVVTMTGAIPQWSGEEQPEDDHVKLLMRFKEDGVFNLSVAFGEPWSRNFTANVAKVTTFERPSFEIAFPPDGYEFGMGVEPFVMCSLEDEASRHRELHSRGATALVTVQTSLIQPVGSAGESRVTQGRTMQHIKLGQHPPGRYQLEIRPFDDLWRPIASPRAITFTVLSAHSVSRCVAGDAHCTPQRPRKSSDHASNGEAHNMSSFVDHCPPLTPLVCAGGCSGHGECTAGACRCSGDWIGHDCRHHVLSMTHFAPEVHPSERASRCHQTAAIGRGVDAFAYRLDDLQFPSSCTSLFQRRFNKTQGLGATLRWTALSLSVSLSRGETLVVGGRWGAFNYEGCADRGVWCLLQRITNCTVSSWAWDDIAEADFFMPDQLSIPYGGVEQGQLWWTSLLTHAALRPSVLLEAKLRRARNNLSWPSRGVVGLHVRHGDSCTDPSRPTCIPSAKYFAEAEALALRYGFIDIFLATDDEAVVVTSRKRPGFRYMSLSMDRKRLFDSQMFIEHRLAWGVVDRRGVSEATFIDLFLLSSCQAFVGSFFSHFSRAAYELMVGSSGDFMPYASLDVPWAPMRPIVPYKA